MWGGQSSWGVRGSDPGVASHTWTTAVAVRLKCGLVYPRVRVGPRAPSAVAAPSRFRPSHLKNPPVPSGCELALPALKNRRPISKRSVATCRVQERFDKLQVPVSVANGAAAIVQKTCAPIERPKKSFRWPVSLKPRPYEPLAPMQRIIPSLCGRSPRRMGKRISQAVHEGRICYRKATLEPRRGTRGCRAIDGEYDFGRQAFCVSHKPISLKPPGTHRHCAIKSLSACELNEKGEQRCGSF